MIVKPHGSIDFRGFIEVVFGFFPVGYPLQNVATRNDLPRRVLSPHEFLEPRTEVDLIAPQESSWTRDFQWVRPGYE